MPLERQRLRLGAEDILVDAESRDHHERRGQQDLKISSGQTQHAQNPLAEVPCRGVSRGEGMLSDSLKWQEAMLETVTRQLSP